MFPFSFPITILTYTQTHTHTIQRTLHTHTHTQYNAYYTHKTHNAHYTHTHTHITHTENQMPSQLPSAAVDYEWTEHTREGFAVVNITWDPPNWSEFIGSYNITIFSQSDGCGGHQKMIHFINIGRVSFNTTTTLHTLTHEVQCCTLTHEVQCCTLTHEIQCCTHSHTK